MGLFGGGNSSSSSTNLTTSNDGRVVGADGSTNTSLTGNTGTVNLTLTDAGAVSGALDLARAGIEQTYSAAREAQATQGTLLQGVLTTVGKQQQQFTAAIENIKTSDVRVLVVAGLAVVGLAAFYMLKGR